jgi:hypothetical protein
MGVYQGVSHLYQPKTPQEAKIGYFDEAGLIKGYTEQTGVKFISYSSEAKPYYRNTAVFRFVLAAISR